MLGDFCTYLFDALCICGNTSMTLSIVYKVKSKTLLPLSDCAHIGFGSQISNCAIAHVSLMLHDCVFLFVYFSVSLCVETADAFPSLLVLV